MAASTFEQFSESARAEGFDEVPVREWAPHAVIDTHTHPFDASLLVVREEYWLTVGDRVHHLKTGDTFVVPRDVPHAERYGAEGTTLWVARRAVTR